MLATLPVDTVLGRVVCTIEQFSQSACCGCQKQGRSRGTASSAGAQRDGAFGHLFAVRPLGSQVSPEAGQATQQAARLMHEGRRDEALTELHAAKRLAPACALAYTNIGGAYHLSGDSNSALAWYREAHRMAPRDAECAQALAYLEQRRGASEESLQLLLRFLQEVDENHVEVLGQLGQLRQERAEWPQAAQIYRKLSHLEPNNADWPVQLQTCTDQLPRAQPAAAVQPAGFNNMLAMAFSIAEPVLRSTMPISTKDTLAIISPRSQPPTIAKSPSSLFATPGLQSRAPVPVINGQPPGSGIWPLSPSGAPKSPPGMPLGGPGSPQNSQQLQEARRHRGSGRFEEALGIYEGLLRRERHSTDALLGIVDCQYDLGNFDQALEAAKRLLGLRPDDPEANLRVAELLFAMGHEPDMAEPYLNRAKGCEPVPHVLHLRVLCAGAELALAREDQVKALAIASEAVRMDASSARALMLLGTARLRVADYSGALRAFRAALDTGGEGPDAKKLRAAAFSGIAEAHERLREYPQALENVRRALELGPNLGAPRVVRAVAMHQTGQTRQAEAELVSVLQQDPQNGPARLQLGYCQLSSNSSQAVATLEGLSTLQKVSRSCLGAAKVYLALAHDSQPDRSGPQCADLAVREGLSLHKNLQHVWREIQSGPPDQPLSGLQKLRGICDLDLTSSQARQLMGLLARATGRPDLSRALAGSQAPKGAQRRGPSVPPQRRSSFGQLEAQSYAPSGLSTPSGQGAHAAYRFPGAGAAPPHRGRSASPSQRAGGSQFVWPGAPASGDPVGGVPGRPSQHPQQGPRPRMGGSRAQSRGQSPTRGGGGDLTIGWNELIRPEQLSFGPTLGSGGSAQVYRGSWQGQEVAIKKISGVAHLEEMKKEINALRRLRHSRLVRFIGACVQPPQLLVVTEFMSGGSLHDRIFGARRSPPLMPMQKWTIACHMVEGLAFLHSQRVVHRDLKSMNILLDAIGNAKICDFGLAQNMELSATSIPRKLDGEGGSPRYMAPECYDAMHGKLTEKVDIWAIGCIFIELFGGVLPYSDCSTMAQLSGRILVERRPPDVPATVAPPLAILTRRCLTFDPPRRPHAAELQGDLNRLRPC